MDIKIPFFVVLCYLLVNHFEVDASLSKEDIHLERELRIINKPALTTIKTVYGDLYDCVDFYKQPAFDHPALKNHTFYPEMDYKPQWKRNNSSSVNGYVFESFKDGGCPHGSVPIKRTTKSDLIREKKYFSKFGSGTSCNDYALVHTGAGPFNGGGMVAGVYKPQASGKQYSAVRMKIQRGDDAIQVGWRVDPSLYGDDKVRFYLYYKSGETHCFYTRCPGFVVVNKKYPLEYIFTKYYKAGDTKSVEVEINLARDAATGNWWVQIGSGIPLGFWPADLFTSLREMGDYVDWGGEVYNTEDKKLVDMGLGSLATKDTNKTAYIRVLEVSTGDRKTIDAPETISYTSDEDHYRVLNYDHDDNYYGHIVFYGGPNENI